ncbi:hypothetical protein [Hymenobacter pini]|uniref:hypothetical protein n=1 Tax=Hymenobacter pini TaxID=2880879 RepID=UPI001CF3BCD1|nr:hypothetical protein [Hymenobacter pini]MCA8832015.1 hypothetical protein [Hymenobacter pini]
MPCLLVRWHGFANSQHLRLVLDTALDFYRRYAPQYPRLGWVSDARYFGAMLPADQEWAASDWNHRAYAAGIRQLIFISPENIFGQIALQQFSRRLMQKNALQATHVASPADAWARVWAAA